MKSKTQRVATLPCEIVGSVLTHGGKWTGFLCHSSFNDRTCNWYSAVRQESEELEKAQQEQQSNLMVDMKKEMAAMQKKILMDCVSTANHILTDHL